MRTLLQIAEREKSPAISPAEGLFELSGDLLCVIDAEGTLRRINSAFTDTLGWSSSSAISRPYLDFVHRGDRDRVDLSIQRCITGDGSGPDDSRWRCKDGSYRWLSWRSSSPDENGLMIVVGRDITHTKHVVAELSALQEYAAVGIAMCDATGRLLKVNPAFCEMVGYAEDELLRMNSRDITQPRDRVLQADYLRRLASGEVRSYIAEKQYVRKNGSTIWTRVTLSAVRDASVPIQTFIGVVEDISESKNRAVALAESESRYFRVASNVPGVVYQYRIERDGTVSFPFVSSGATDLYEVTPAEIQANPNLVFDAVHPDDREHFHASMAAAVRSHSPWRWTGRMVVGKTEKWVEGCARPQQLHDGATVWDGLLRDITEVHEAALQLQGSEHRYRSLFENHPDAVFSLDCTGRFQAANPACSALCGYENEEMLGQAFDPLLVPEQVETVYAQLNRALHGSATTFDLTLRHKSGRHVEVSLTYIPVIVGGEITGVFGIARDLTDQRELEAQLRQAQKMEAVGQLAAGVAHDFNNVLTVIQGCSEFLVASLPEGDERREDVDMIREAAARAAMLTRQLLAFSRKQVLQPTVVDLNSCIEELQAMLARTLGEDVVLVTEMASDLGFISADAGQLEQVMVNMAVNARDAMPDGGRLSLTTSNCMVDDAHVRLHPGATPGPHVRLSITDTGCGMDEATISRIFEPFFTTKGPGRGTGLGLATAYGIIRQSSGHITVTSTPGIGTTFDIYLPNIRAQVATSERDHQYALGHAPASASRHGTDTILLVEDDTTVRCLASQMLTRDGFGVVEAANGAEALATVRAWDGKIDLVLTDAMMPVMNGGELADALSREFPDIKVLFMSLFTGDDIVRRGADSRRAFIPKPFTASDLTQKVRDVLATVRDVA
jgi:two-component system cell cycle sensor histidine kinase/response regulator CckA